MPLTQKQFFERIRRTAPKRKKSEMDELMANLGQQFIVLKEGDAEWGVIPTGFLDIGEAAPVVKRCNIDTLDNFVYDKATGVVITKLFGGGHQQFTYAMYALVTGKRMWKEYKDFEKYADAYIEEGHGIVLSSVSSVPLKGRIMRLNAQEKRVFKDWTFREIGDDE